MEFYEFYKKNTSIFLRRDWDQTIQLSDIYSQITRDSLFRFWTCNLPHRDQYCYLPLD